MFLKASYVAKARLNVVLVLPFVLAHISLTPANSETRFATSPAARPIPFGAGFNVISTLPDLPVTLNGIECLSTQLHSQEPHPRSI